MSCIPLLEKAILDLGFNMIWLKSKVKVFNGLMLLGKILNLLKVTQFFCAIKQ